MLGCGSATDGAGVIDENVDGAEGLDRVIDQHVSDFLVADIARTADELDAGLFDFVYGRVQHRAVVVQGDICACLRKGDGHSGSETLSGSGNQRIFAFETEEIENTHDIAPLLHCIELQ